MRTITILSEPFNIIDIHPVAPHGTIASYGLWHDSELSTLIYQTTCQLQGEPYTDLADLCGHLLNCGGDEGLCLYDNILEMVRGTERHLQYNANEGLWLCPQHYSQAMKGDYGY